MRNLEKQVVLPPMIDKNVSEIDLFVYFFDNLFLPYF